MVIVLQVESGDGVYLSSKQKGSVDIGTLLGFVPGIIYNSYESQTFLQDSKKEEITFFQRYDDFIIDFSQKIYYPFNLGHCYTDIQHINNKLEERKQQFKSVPGEFINPYAWGHKINHSPPDTCANVIVQDLLIPNHFFPSNYLRYLPYLKFSNDQESKLKEYFHNDCIRGVGVFALRDIYDGEELYMDYFNAKLYQKDRMLKDWLLKPPPIQPYLTKHSYQSKISFLANLIDNHYNNKNLQQYIDFKNQTSHDPTIFQQQKLIQNTINKNKQKK